MTHDFYMFQPCPAAMLVIANLNRLQEFVLITEELFL